MAHANEARRLAAGFELGRVRVETKVRASWFPIAHEMATDEWWPIQDAPEKCFAPAEIYPHWRRDLGGSMVWRLDGPGFAEGRCWYLDEKPVCEVGRAATFLARDDSSRPVIPEAEAKRLIKQAQGPGAGPWQAKWEYTGEFRLPRVGPGGDCWLGKNDPRFLIFDGKGLHCRPLAAVDNGNRFILRRKAPTVRWYVDGGTAVNLYRVESGRCRVIPIGKYSVADERDSGMWNPAGVTTEITDAEAQELLVDREQRRAEAKKATEQAVQCRVRRAGARAVRRRRRAAEAKAKLFPRWFAHTAGSIWRMDSETAGTCFQVSGAIIDAASTVADLRRDPQVREIARAEAEAMWMKRLDR